MTLAVGAERDAESGRRNLPFDVNGCSIARGQLPVKHDTAVCVVCFQITQRDNPAPSISLNKNRAVDYMSLLFGVLLSSDLE